MFYVWLSAKHLIADRLSANALNAVDDATNCLAALALFWCFFVLDKPSVKTPGNQNRDVPFRNAIAITWVVGSIVMGLAIADRLLNLNGFGVVCVGLYNGLAVAFFVGRFDSHWMSVPRWMLAPLYSYALIQMVYVFLGRLDPMWAIMTYIAALLLKIALFVVVGHLLNDGKLYAYLRARGGRETRTLHSRSSVFEPIMSFADLREA